MTSSTPFCFSSIIHDAFIPFATLDLQQRDSDCIERFHDSVNLVMPRLLFFVNLGDCYGFIRFNLDAAVGTPSLL